MPAPIRRLRGRMVRQHYRTAMGCACQAWCDGYNECRTDETSRADKAEKRLATMATEPDGWEPFEDPEWTVGFAVWRHASGAVVWRSTADSVPPGWACSSSVENPVHGDVKPCVGAIYPPWADTLQEAKTLALALRKAAG